MSEIIPEVLLISSKHDYSTDYISYYLNKKGIPFFRLNRDELFHYKYRIDPIKSEMIINIDEITIKILPKKLRSIYFRAPTYLRNYPGSASIFDQFSRSQSQALIKSLVILDKAFWVNHPVNTYRSEIKPLQLKIAKKVGFRVPETFVANNFDMMNFALNSSDKLAVKTIDTAYMKLKSGASAFVYTGIHDRNKCQSTGNLPAIIQEALVPKVDVRITVVGNKIYSVLLRSNEEQYSYSDWRLHKNNITYEVIDLPKKIEIFCLKFLEEFGLNFAAIDLLLYNGEYYFVEVNPTGEWVWIMENTGLKIAEGIVDLLVSGKGAQTVC